jgi:hypothetical protein
MKLYYIVVFLFSFGRLLSRRACSQLIGTYEERPQVMMALFLLWIVETKKSTYMILVGFRMTEEQIQVRRRAYVLLYGKNDVGKIPSPVNFLRQRRVWNLCPPQTKKLLFLDDPTTTEIGVT